jgi:hypothetical protein
VPKQSMPDARLEDNGCHVFTGLLGWSSPPLRKSWSSSETLAILMSPSCSKARVGRARNWWLGSSITAGQRASSCRLIAAPCLGTYWKADCLVMSWALSRGPCIGARPDIGPRIDPPDLRPHFRHDHVAQEHVNRDMIRASNIQKLRVH